MTQPSRYLILPLTQYLDFVDSLDAAKAKAAEMTTQYSDLKDGFCIIQAEFIGSFEHVRPIWHDQDPANDPKEPYIITQSELRR
jgi:hypothetical protein